MASDVANCRSCNASILWLKHHSTGKLAPIDAEPVTDGNVVVDRETGTYRTLTKDLFEAAADGARHKNHFATCKFAAQHHKRRA